MRSGCSATSAAASCRRPVSASSCSDWRPKRAGELRVHPDMLRHAASYALANDSHYQHPELVHLAELMGQCLAPVARGEGVMAGAVCATVFAVAWTLIRGGIAGLPAGLWQHPFRRRAAVSPNDLSTFPGLHRVRRWRTFRRGVRCGVLVDR